MSDIPHSKKMNVILIILGSVAVVFIVFSLGVYVGYRKALFASGRDENYYRNFLGGTSNMGSPFSAGIPGAIHGIVGTVIGVVSSSIIVKDGDSDEESVTVSSGTAIRRMDKAIDEDGIMVGDGVAVIGQPNAFGQIDAQFIRVFPAASPLPLPPESTSVPSGSSPNINIYLQ